MKLLEKENAVCTYTKTTKGLEPACTPVYFTNIEISGTYGYKFCQFCGKKLR